MTVAAFFRDARALGAWTGAPPPQAGNLIRDFLDQFGYDDCDPPQLLALSDLAMRCGESAVARGALGRLISAGHNPHIAYYRLGRLELLEGEAQAALRNYRLGTQADPEFAYCWMGQARALQLLGDPDAAVVSAERFMAFGVRPHTAAELAALAELGDHLFDAGDRRRSLKFYEMVVKFGADRPRDAVRLAEAHITAGDYTAAHRLLRAQEKRKRLDSWGRRALALSLSHLGEHDAAIEAAEAVVIESPANAGFVATYLDVLSRSGDIARMRDALERHAALLEGNAAWELRTRVKLANGGIEGALFDLNAADIGYQSRLYYLCFETAYAALAAGLHDIAQTLGERLGNLAPCDIFVKLLRIDIYFRQQMWEEAGALLGAMTDEENARPHVLLKRFEYACFVGDVPLATKLCAELEAIELPNKQFMLPVFRFFAERQMWNEVIDRALPWLDGQLNYAQIGYVLFRAAKHSGRHADLIGAVEALAQWAERPDLVKLRANLEYDRAEGLPAIERLLEDPFITADPMFRRRLEVKRDVLARAMAQGQRRALFLCSNANYLCATFVALYSASQMVDHRGLDAFLVVDDELTGLARRAAAPFAQAGLSVTIVSASEVVDAAEKLYAGYGLFTSGHQLASAAYYRIYFAKYLQRVGRYERAVYIDSDVLVRGRLDPLFGTDLGGRPIAAKVETMRPEVRRAIALHQLVDDRYFNSGVLLFDLRNEQLAPGLDGAVSAILDDQTTLLFHDQCALNLGFRSGFADLDRVWNYVVTEDTKLADVPPSATILHFLDRPKPWSAAYGGEAGVLWFDRWRETAAFIGEAVSMELFALIQD